MPTALVTVSRFNFGAVHRRIRRKKDEARESQQGIAIDSTGTYTVTERKSSLPASGAPPLARRRGRASTRTHHHEEAADGDEHTSSGSYTIDSSGVRGNDQICDADAPLQEAELSRKSTALKLEGHKSAHEAGLSETKQSATQDGSIKSRRVRTSPRFVWSKEGIRRSVAPRDRVSKATVARQAAIANRHARLLEQLIRGDMQAGQGRNSPQSNKHHAKAQAKKAKQMTELKAALMNPSLANGIISELRTMQVEDNVVALQAPTYDVAIDQQDAPDTSPLVRRATALGFEKTAQVVLRDALSAMGEQEERSRAPQAKSGLVRMICLDCDEATALTRHAFQTEHVSAPALPAEEKGAAQGSAATGSVERIVATANTRYSASWLPWYGKLDANRQGGDQTLITQAATSRTADESPISLLSTGAMPQVPTVFGMSPISLVMAPKGTVVTAGVEKLGAFDAAATISAIAISATGTNLGLAAPTDRMSIFIHWWGFEIALPKATLAYLSTAQNVSGAFLNFLTTMAVSGGVPELIPFIRYISMFIDTEFKAIAAQDKGRGVAIAAVWAFPFALVPRPCEFCGDRSSCSALKPAFAIRGLRGPFPRDPISSVAVTPFRRQDALSTLDTVSSNLATSRGVHDHFHTLFSPDVIATASAPTMRCKRKRSYRQKSASALTSDGSSSPKSCSDASGLTNGNSKISE